MPLVIKPRVGDKVSIDHPDYPGIYTVKSVSGPKNAVLTPDSGGRGLRCPYGWLIEPGAATTPVATTSVFDLGTVIRIAEGSKWDGDWVVIKDDGGDRVNLAQLGGGRGTEYLRHSRRGLTKIDLADI